MPEYLSLEFLTRTRKDSSVPRLRLFRQSDACRNVEGKVILYADNITGSMKKAIGETEKEEKFSLNIIKT